MAEGLKKLKLSPFSTSEIHPEGWLLNQLKIQAAGLSGNLDKFWPDIRDSKWIGGTAEGWERVPYWLDGFIPLAWLLDDEDMKARATKYIDSIISQQEDDGWLCPVEKEHRNTYDMWALLLILKVLVVYQDASGDERIETVVYKALKAFDLHIDGNTLFNWGSSRWFEGLIPIFWLYERTEEPWLLDLASKLHTQGFDWQALFKHWPYKRPDVKGRWSFMSHVVNNAMMLKSGGLLWRMTGKEEDLNSAESMLRLLDEYHGMVTGVFTGDECLNGTSPVQGTELCSVAELMYSLEILLSISGKSYWADRLEKVAFNALPATFSPDMWTHQYDQQVNQVQCSYQENPVFSTNGGYSHTFGLEPNFGCCTANLSQPWPKFALSTMFRTDNGIAAAAYAPCSLKTEIQSSKVQITMNTNYPFRDKIEFRVITDRMVEFTMNLRIPEWTKEPLLQIGEERIMPKPGDFYELKYLWSGDTKFTLTLPMPVEIISRPENLYAVQRGPLIYSLPVGEKWVQINKEMPVHEFPHCDYEIYPTTPWNYGLCIEKEKPEEYIHFEEQPIGEVPFSPEGAPIIATVKGRQIEWPLVNGSAAPVPLSLKTPGEIEELKLIPYGCTNLRLTEIPII